MKSFILLSLILMLLSFSCEKNNNNEPGDQNENNLPVSMEKSKQKIISADNAFGLELFEKLVKNEETEKNIFISPVSVALALAMTYNGAEEETKTQMESALKLSGLSREQINAVYKSLINELVTLDEDVQLSIANSIWYRKDFQIENDFIETNRSNYDAIVEALDFSDLTAKDIINGWVEDKTEGKITDLIDRIDPQHVMFLINAIYFKGIWTYEFDEENTRNAPFYLSKNESIETPAMHREDTIPYFSTDSFQAIQLPYGKGNYQMIVILPNKDKSPDNIIGSFTPENWDSWLNSFKKEKKVNLALPKFKFKYDKKLNDILSEMGMPSAFTPSANFTDIHKNGGIYIDYVKHKSFVEVNEKGTEAAAATVVGIARTSVDMNIIHFQVNRPFIFAIIETDSNAITFLGKVSNPVWEDE